MNLNCSVIASALSFVFSSVTTGIGYYDFLKLCEAVSFISASCSARKYYSVSQFLFAAMDIFFPETRLLILPAIRQVYGLTAVVF